MALTFFLTIIWDVEVGIAVSLVISLLLVVHRSSKTRLTILVRYSASGALIVVFIQYTRVAYLAQSSGRRLARNPKLQKTYRVS